MKSMSPSKVKNIIPEGDLFRVMLFDGGSFLISFWFLAGEIDLAGQEYSKGCTRFIYDDCLDPTPNVA